MTPAVPDAAGTGLRALLDDLTAEQQALIDLLRGLDDDDWLRPTPARGWDVRDTVSHLADTDEMAIATATGAPGSLNARSDVSASGEDVTFRGVLRGRRRSGREVCAWFESSTASLHDMFLALDPVERVPWGIGMRPPSLVSARLMETWAHGLDVHAAVHAEPTDTDRLAHVAWLATRALPYAYSVAGREPPAEAVRVDLTLPSGAGWTTGPAGAANRITGSASEYCRIFVHRLAAADATSLRTEGFAAADALRVARAYL
jgi:uncharacterized protein (TIGR03084 family)